MSPDDQQHLRRAIRLAMNGRGLVEPNPMVGCVLARNGRVIGEGWHAHFGGPHAEPTALASCTEPPAGATAYVTLEPCCHTNKKTPPCVPRLIEAKIARVVIGCLDPNPQVNGNGIRLLRDSGITVNGPLLEAECKQLIAPFLARVNQHRPYVTLKWAESADGKIAGPAGARLQISNSVSTAIVHQLRGRCDAIAVGVGTVLADDPELTVRRVPAARIPHRFVFDSALRTPLNSKLVQTASAIPTTIFFTEAPAERRNSLANLNVNLIEIAKDNAGKLDLSSALQSMTQTTHLLVEAGSIVAASFFARGLADRLWVFRSPAVIGDATAPPAALIPDHFQQTGQLKLGNDELTEYLNTSSPVFYSRTASADLVLTKPAGGE